MSSYDEFKTFYTSNIILFIVLLFVIVYIIINWNFVYAGEYFSGDYVKPLLISGILFLIFHLTLTWDDDDNTHQNIPNEKKSNFVDEYDIPKFKLANINKLPGIIQEPQTNILNNDVPVGPNLTKVYGQENKFGSKYKIINKFDNPINNSKSNSEMNRSNTNIFVSRGNLSKYGIKFN